MSWLYSQALVAEYSAASCSGGEQFAPLSGSPIPQAYLPSDRMTAFSRLSRFGMTFAPLTDCLGAELLTLYLAASRARTSAPPEKAQVSTVSEAGYGAKWHELSVRYDRDSSSWKTHRCLWEEDLPWSSVTLPKWGSMRDGVCSERMTLAHRTDVSDAGLWATPSATDGQRGGTITENMTGVSLAQMVKTPERWPTPTACMSKGTSPAATVRKSGQSREKDRLDHAVLIRMWPTPTAMTNTGGAALCKWGGSGARAKLRKMVTPQELNGALNPTWVEWLMGWPLGWTDLKPSATDKSRNAPPKPGES